MDRLQEQLLARLTQDPAASMSDLAEAAGVSRATLFRRYPSRHDLVVALSRAAVLALEEAVERARPEEGAPVEALRRVCLEVAALGPGMGVLVLQPLAAEAEAGLLEQAASSEARVVALVRRGQRAGDVAVEADPTWVLAALTWLTVGAADEVRRGRLAPARVPELVAGGVLAAAGVGGGKGGTTGLVP